MSQFYVAIPYMVAEGLGYSLDRVLQLAAKEGHGWGKRLAWHRPTKREYSIISGAYMAEINTAVGRGLPTYLAPYKEVIHKGSTRWAANSPKGLTRWANPYIGPNPRILAWPMLLALAPEATLDQDLFRLRWQKPHPYGAVIIHEFLTLDQAWEYMLTCWAKLWFTTLPARELANFIVGFRALRIRGMSHTGLLYGQMERLRSLARGIALTDSLPGPKVRVNFDVIEDMSVRELKQFLVAQFKAINVKLDEMQAGEVASDMKLNVSKMIQ